MFCDQCGSAVPPNAQFCPSCGKSLGNVRTMPESRLAGHLRLLGVFWLAGGALNLLAGAGAMMAAHVILPRIPGIPSFVPGLVAGVAVLAWVKAGACLMAGWGLLQREPWARILAIVLAFISLLNVPLGTALGIYTLWVLLPDRSAREYEALARAA